MDYRPNKLQSLYRDEVLLASPGENEHPCVWWDPAAGIPARGLVDQTTMGRAPILFINKNPGHAVSDQNEQRIFKEHAGKDSILEAYNDWIGQRLLTDSKWPLMRGIEWYAKELLGISPQDTWKRYVISTNAVKVSTHKKTGQKIPDDVYKRWLPLLLKEIKTIKPAVILVGGTEASKFLKANSRNLDFHYVTHPSWVPTPHGDLAREIIDKIRDDVKARVDTWLRSESGQM
jgi:hypothetical protein